MRQDVEKEAGLVSTMCIKDYRSRKSEYRCHSKLHTIEADILGPVTMAKNLRAKQILVLTDLITRYVLSVPLRGTKAADAAKEIVENWVLGFGVADVLRTDQRKKFGNELMLEVCKLLKIDKSSSSTYHPKGKGQMERHDRVIADVNSKYNSRTWSVINPESLFYLKPQDEQLSRDSFCENLSRLFREACSSARESLGLNQQWKKDQYHKKVYGKPYGKQDEVWVYPKQKAKFFSHGKVLNALSEEIIAFKIVLHNFEYLLDGDLSSVSRGLIPATMIPPEVLQRILEFLMLDRMREAIP
ncbi:uncharacterized protein LOC142344967 [Convolutriloba macropyga]|uniref:uncharacterized protein LOC142344967 n=1 Tax=Convolutriloba macropyga TaxID=536237 RepID=UPI003F52424A